MRAQDEGLRKRLRAALKHLMLSLSKHTATEAIDRFTIAGGALLKFRFARGGTGAYRS